LASRSPVPNSKFPPRRSNKQWVNFQVLDLEIGPLCTIITLMPSRYNIREYCAETYYHIFNRGAGKNKIFIDDTDYVVFLSFLKRHLSNEPIKDNKGREYLNFSKEIELLAFCLMPNHYHLFIYQRNAPDSYSKLLKSVSTAYTMYFNQKYKRTGHLFQERFKASTINDEAYLQHISRYIHLNPENYKNWEWSSLPYYLEQKSASWVKPNRILSLFNDATEYEFFIDDYRNYQKTAETTEELLAGY
jgi:putative transposase